MICQYNNNETCLNDGTCIPIDENVISQKKFLCICPKGSSGDRCEILDAKLILSFDKDIILPEYIIVHFIEIIPNAEHINGSTFKIIPINENSITIYWSHPFHIAFVELNDNDYYLISVKNTFNRSEIIIQTINSLNRCKYISEVLNKTLVNLHLIRRIKYYHLPCQNSSSNLSCFYDDDYFCLCNNFDLKRLSNCLEFNSTRKPDCSDESKCQNGALCIQDSNICPQISICVCEKCYYGTLCQFSSNLFGLSLDAFLGYYIQPHISIRSQPSIVQISLILIIIITIGGLVNGIFSLITFKSKESCQTGSGCYLLSASITNVFTMIIFALKFFILLIAQMTYITNRSFLSVQCYSMDFFLQVGLNIDRWLCACVAIERSILSIQGTKFNKQKSKKISKYIIFIVISLIMITHIPDSIHRRLIDDNDNDEKRIWCIVSYSSFLQIFNSIINLIHFFIPFLINLISPIIIIKVQIQQRLTVQPDQNYRQLFYEQCRRHTHLLIASVVLIILSIPRLFISFISTCMKSSGSNSWILLFGYIISFIPLILHFILFVLPSKLFKHEFQKRIRFYQKIIRRRLYLTL